MASTSFISPSRITVIAGQTFTQLVRMKVFTFVAIFAVLLFGLQMIDLPLSSSSGDSTEQALRLIKSGGFFAMNIFSLLLALGATALLIPKDIEDRTLYTILCKPVPRLDYLLGKLLGVLGLIALSLLVMDGLFSCILHWKTQSLVAMEMQWLKDPEAIARRTAEIEALGVTANLHWAVLSIFCKAAVITAVALLISTFSTSTLFTIITSVIVLLIGLIQADAREYLLRQQEIGVTSSLNTVTQIIAIFFPDFQVLGVEDAVIDGKKIPTNIIGRVGLITALYCAIYTVLSWFVFRKKEF